MLGMFGMASAALVWRRRRRHRADGKGKVAA
jgi:hypothetical protein